MTDYLPYMAENITLFKEKIQTRHTAKSISGQNQRVENQKNLGSKIGNGWFIPFFIFDFRVPLIELKCAL